MPSTNCAYPFLSICLLAVLTGCAIAPTARPSPELGQTIRGVVLGGQQPVAGAHVYLFAANTTGYAGYGIAASTSNASVSVFTAAETGLSDAVGPYILTTEGGNFTFPTYVCTPGTQLYVLGLGGNPGAGANSALGLMAALGPCPTAGNLNTTIPYISINEISTVAAAYAMAGFATDSTHVSSAGSALAQTGIANAFLNATNLADIGSGAALATTPAGNGTVPRNEIITLADILAFCVNSNDSNGSISQNCSRLFGYTSSGTAATDTASAAINIAHNPGTNVANLFSLVTATPVYVTNGIYNQPNDFTIGLSFTGGGLSAPNAIAIDASGDAWITNFNFRTGSVIELSNLGAILSGTSGYTYGLNSPIAIAIDLYGNAWIANDVQNGGVTKLNSSGNPLPNSPFARIAQDHPSFIAIDAAGSVWITNPNSNSVTKLNNNGSAVTGSPFSVGGLNGPAGISIDGAGSAWIANVLNGGSVTKLSNSGAALITGDTSGGISEPGETAIDASGNAWITNSGYGPSTVVVTKLTNSGSAAAGSPFYFSTNGDASVVGIDGSGDIWTDYSSNSVAEFTNAGSPISGSNGYAGGGIQNPSGTAIDGSGDVWIINSSYPTAIVTELIGAATPVITPICAGLPSTPTSDGTSNLGTRP